MFSSASKPEPEVQQSQGGKDRVETHPPLCALSTKHSPVGGRGLSRLMHTLNTTFLNSLWTCKAVGWWVGVLCGQSGSPSTAHPLSFSP